jgi:hypothetical protein
VAVRHVGGRAERVADAVARAVVDARDGGSGEPGGLLAEKPRGQVLRRRFGARQAFGEESQRM